MSRDRDVSRGGGTGGKILLALIMASLAREAFAAQPKSSITTNTNDTNITATPTHENTANPKIAKLDGKNFPTMGEVTISKKVFLQLIKDSKSPIPESEASAIYDTAVSKHVDPNFLLAVGNHESNLGKNGVARTTKNFCNMRPWWNVKTQPTPSGLALYHNAYGYYVDFSKLDKPWYHSADACINAVVGWSHIKGHKLSVNEQISLFAPPSDHNNTAVYIAAVKSDMMRHNKESLGIVGETPNYYLVRRDTFS